MGFNLHILSRVSKAVFPLIALTGYGIIHKWKYVENKK
jgi:hypothetical protein